MQSNASAAERTHNPTRPSATRTPREMSAPAANPLARVFRGVWTAVRPLNADTSFYQVRLDSPAGSDATLDFLPGQFVQIYRAADPKARSRAYSIASTPEQLPLLDFCIKRYPKGLLSRYLATVKPGDPVALRGPFGRFKVGVGDTHIFVVTGTGIAPVRAMLSELMSKRPTARITLIHGHRSADGIFFRHEFKKLAAEHSNFNYIASVSHSDATNPSERGYVTDILQSLKLEPETRYYLCGNPAMVRTASLQLLDRNIRITQIAVEKW